MINGRAFALAVAGATLVVALPASADTTPLPSGPPAVAPAPPPGAYPPGAYPPGAYPPGAYPPGAYPPGAYPPPPGAYPGGYPPPPGAYYGPQPGYYAPPGAYALPPPMQRQSTGAMVGGIVGISLGGVLLLSAAVAAALADSCSVDNNGFTTCSSNEGAAIGLTVAGIVLIAVGIPLVIYGARRVPLGSALVPGQSNAFASPLPAWAGAPGGTGWRWKF
jgi:hypothetical protein